LFFIGKTAVFQKNFNNIFIYVRSIFKFCFIRIFQRFILLYYISMIDKIPAHILEVNKKFGEAGI